MITSEKHNSGDSPSLRCTSHRSISPSGRFCSSTISSSSSNLTSSSSPARSTSPTTNTARRSGGYVSSSPSIRFSINHRHKSPHRTVSSSNNINRSCNRNNNNSNVWSHGSKKTCLCSTTTHRGSFRCSLHKHSNTVSYCDYRLYDRRSAMSNSVVRIGTVEGDLVKRALAALIRPSSHHRRRRSDFQPRRSR